MATKEQMLTWAKSKIGCWIDVDKHYGAQCVDLAMLYTKTFGNFQMHGNAIDYLSNPLPPNWKRYKKGEIAIEAGDIAIWKWGHGDTYGHVGIVLSVKDNYITSVEQNVTNPNLTTGGRAEVRTRGSLYLAGFIRPSYSADTWVLVSENGTFCVDVNCINVREKPSLYAKKVAFYRKGNIINYDNYVINEGFIWISYLSYSGVRRYLAIGTHNGKERTSIWGHFL